MPDQHSTDEPELDTELGCSITVPTKNGSLRLDYGAGASGPLLHVRIDAHDESAGDFVDPVELFTAVDQAADAAKQLYEARGEVD